MFNILLLDTGCCAWLCPWWLVWTLGAFLLGALLHHLLFCSKKDRQIADLTVERDGYHAKFTNAEKDLASLKYQLDEANKHMAHLKGKLSICEADKAMLVARAAAAAGDDGDLSGGALGFAAGALVGERSLTEGGVNYAGLLGSDNLQIIEGVGPKIEGLLKDGGINNWRELADASVTRLQEILDAAGSRYRLANPKTWPQQAKLAHEGKWDELIEYQKFLDAGVENKGDLESPAKVEKLITKLLGFSTNSNDLKIVEGIGPKIEALLKGGGINTWADLAEATESRLQEILKEAGDRYRLADPSSWAKQASLAVGGKWNELKSYQDSLSGGKEPS